MKRWQKDISTTFALSPLPTNPFDMAVPKIYIRGSVILKSNPDPEECIELSAASGNEEEMGTYTVQFMQTRSICVALNVVWSEALRLSQMEAG